MEGRWSQGIFLGYARDSNTYTVATPEGIAQTRTMMRRPFEARWNHEAILHAMDDVEAGCGE